VNAPGQHHVLALGGDEDADPEARPARQSSVVGAVAGALVLGTLGWLAGKYMLPAWGGWVGVLGAFVGAYIGSLYGAIAGLSWKATRNRIDRPAADNSAYAPRKAGIVLAVHLREAGPDRAGEALRTLGTLGARDIEVTQGEWDQGWTDFDPVREPHRVAERTTADQRL
jgi:predicted lipid-binding transport protein (Tim44 family)